MVLFVDAGYKHRAFKMAVTVYQAAYCVIYIFMLHVFCPCHAAEPSSTFGPATVRTNLSVLLISNFYIGHQLPMVALGEELASRGHKAAILSPELEGSSVFTNLPSGVEFISPGAVMSKKEMEEIVRAGKNVDFFTFIFDKSKVDPSLEWVIRLRKAVDNLDPKRWDYVVVDNTLAVIMYYIMKHWKTNKTMGYMSPLFAPFASSPPWPAPPLLSGLKEDMSFRERLLSAIIDFGLHMTLPLVNKISECEEALKLGGDYIDNFGVTQPVLQTTVLGFEYPRPLLPLMHYTGPLFRRSYPPLDPQLQRWLEDKENRSVVYISMGSTAELTPEQGRNILGGVMASPHNYSVVWALRQSNRNAIEEVKIDPKRTFIASWVSQFTMFQQKAVAMAILHCGIGGVQEALYNKVPVICVPYGYDQFDTAARLEQWGLGIVINSQEVSNAVERVGSGEFDSKVEKMSIILRAPGGTKAAADLVELYAEVGHEHGVPAFAKYQWSWVEYYNLDVLGVLAAAIGVFLWMSVKLLKFCCKMCCC